MLQEADPSGEAHIRMSGGVPFYAELKEGYWDGPYSYIDEEGNYIYTTQGVKVDLYQKNIQDFASDFFNLHNPKRNNWESLKNKFKFNCGISKEREGRRILNNKIPIRCGELTLMDRSHVTLDEIGNKNLGKFV